MRVMKARKRLAITITFLKEADIKKVQELTSVIQGFKQAAIYILGLEHAAAIVKNINKESAGIETIKTT